jgi:hypothetical protein
MIFPFPSSPHCAPIKIVFAMKKVRTTNCPDASGWTHSGLRKMIGCAGAAARDFAGLPFILMLLIMILIPVYGGAP